MEQDSLFDFNFWPSFTDLMLSFVLILIMVISILSGDLDIESAKKAQGQVINNLAAEYCVRPKIGPQENNFDTYIIKLPDQSEIKFVNQIQIQKITFSDKILFESGQSVLREKGREVLAKVVTAIRDQVKTKAIQQIQIEGHTDTTGTDTKNLKLGADRAMAVYQYFQKMEIDPRVHLMSATTYGQYKPVQRTNEDQFNGNIPEGKDVPEDRRIELFLIYRLK